MSDALALVRVLAPAKVNLWLDVLGRRDDGFHELDTGMVALDLFDEVVVWRTRTPGITLELLGPAVTSDVPADASNLAARAAARVLEHSGCDGGLALRLTKRIPSGAGLGGGSSDAAAALIGAAASLAVDLPVAHARSWLAELGSDCVFFFDAAATGFAQCQGRGELVRPRKITDPDWTFALVAPAVHVPTRDVYAALERCLSASPGWSSVREELFSCPEDELRLGLRNRLEAAALDAVRALRPWRQLLDETDARHFVLSGSGSTFFGIYRDEGEARRRLRAVVDAAGKRGLELRGHWLARPAGAGARRAP